MSDLAALQARMQAAVLGTANHGTADDGVGLIAQPPRGDTASRLKVYQNAYVLRLTEIIGADFEQLHRYLGDDGLRRLGPAYVAAYPSDHPNARWFSRRLPQFLADHAPWADHPELADLAGLEGALNAVFDAPDFTPASMADLQAIDPERFAEARFTLSPALQRIQVATNALDIWAALKAEDAPPAPQQAEAVTVLVWRQDNTSRFRALGGEEAMALDALAAGRSFGLMCEMLATYDDPDTAAMRAAGYLVGWTNAQALAGITL